MTIREPFPLRDYQRAAVDEAERRNIICVLPTNSGKTVIAAALIERKLRLENAEGGLARTARRWAAMAPVSTPSGP